VRCGRNCLIDLGQLRNWLFKGLSTESMLDDFEAEGVSVRAATDPAALQRVISLDEFSITIRRAAMQTLPAFLAFFCLENAVREIVVQRLTENHGADWWEKAAPRAVKDKVRQRREKEGRNRWHVQRGANEIYYTDFGDLLLLIQGQWPDFEDLFPDQHWIANRLNDLEASRNIIAHSNQLDEREIDRVKMYLQDWIRQVG
jgi:hypothetical protein